MKIADYSKFILLVLVILTAAVAAFPCTCVSASLKTYYKRADAVVVAKVISVSNLTEGEVSITAKLEIIDAWKKMLPKQIEVISGSSCMYNFQVGEKHLLYLQKAEANRFSTIQCQGNLPFDKSRNSLNWLKRYGKKSRPKLSSSFYLTDFFDVRLSDFLFENETGNCVQTDDGELS
jgi:hypothetical protein